MKQKSFYKLPDEARCLRIKPCFLGLSLSIRRSPEGGYLLIVKMAPVGLEINMHTVLLFYKNNIFLHFVSGDGFYLTRCIERRLEDPLYTTAAFSQHHIPQSSGNSVQQGAWPPQVQLHLLMLLDPLMHESWKTALLCNIHN